MAFNLEQTNDFQENSDINVTPFIDVMLVLLIVFMVAAPLSTVDIKVNLPAMQTSINETINPESEIYVSLKEDKSLFVGEQASNLETFIEIVKNKSNNNLDKTIFLRADAAINYGSLVEVMEKLRENGYLKVALVGLEEL